MATKKTIDIIIAARDRASRVFGKVGAALGGFARTAALAGAAATTAAVAGMAALTRSSLASADSLAKTADRLGLTTEALAQLRFAGEQTGVANRTLEMGLQRMTRRVAEAAKGTGEARNAIKELGLDAAALSAAGPAEAFQTIAERMATVENQSDRVRLAFKLFDSEGVALVNTLGLGREGLRQMAAEADRLGLSLSRVEAARIERANDAMNAMRRSLQGLGNVFAVEFAPLIATAADGISNSIVNLRQQFTSLGVGAVDVAIQMSSMFDVVRNVMHNIGEQVGTVASNVAIFFSNMFNDPKTELQVFFEFWKTHFHNIWEITKNVGENIKDLFIAVFKAIREQSLEPFSDLAFRGLLEGTENAFEAANRRRRELGGQGLDFTTAEFRSLSELSGTTKALIAMKDELRRNTSALAGTDFGSAGVAGGVGAAGGGPGVSSAVLGNRFIGLQQREAARQLTLLKMQVDLDRKIERHASNTVEELRKLRTASSAGGLRLGLT